MTISSIYKLIIFSFLLIVFVPSAHAYAGPGVALGVIVVALTVIVAFFGSLIIKIFNLIVNFLKYIKRKLNSKSKPNKIKINKYK